VKFEGVGHVTSLLVIAQRPYRKVIVAQKETIPIVWNGTMFGDLD